MISLSSTGKTAPREWRRNGRRRHVLLNELFLLIMFAPTLTFATGDVSLANCSGSFGASETATGAGTR